MTIDPDGLTFVSGFFGLAGLVFGAFALLLKRRRDAIQRDIVRDRRTAQKL